MQKWGIVTATILALGAVVFFTVSGFKLMERPMPDVARVERVSTLEEKRVELETKRLEVEALRLRAQLQEGLNQAETEVVHQEVEPHDPRREGALVDAIVAYVDEKEGATLTEPTVVEPVPPSALASFEPDEEAYGDFRGALEPYGDWFETENYGPIWQPDDSYVDTGWQPYTNGSWSYSEYGWTWESDEPFGWACDHYGRWLDVRNRGWCWVPGSEWATAWVSWRSNGKHIGWAALPPCATFNRQIGFGGWVDAHCGIGPGHYNFVSNADFGVKNCRPVIVNRSQNNSLFAGTENITDLHFKSGCVQNHGPDFTTIDRRSVLPIHRSEINLAEEKLAVQQRIDRARDRKASKQVFAVAVAKRGWDGVSGNEEQKRLRRQALAEARRALGGGQKTVRLVSTNKRKDSIGSSGVLPRPLPPQIKVLQKRGAGGKEAVVAKVVDEAIPSTGSDHLDAEQARLDEALAQQDDYQAQRQKMIDARLEKEKEARARLEEHIKVRQDRIAKADRELAEQKQKAAARREERKAASSSVARQAAPQGGSNVAASPSNSAPRQSSSSPAQSSRSSSMFTRTEQHQKAVGRSRLPQKQAQPKPKAAPVSPAPAAQANPKQSAGSVRGTPQKRGSAK